jgi:hypothetical protein
MNLRYHMKDVLKALDRNEDVDILYRGKTKGTLVAHVDRTNEKIADHPFFNMRPSHLSVEAQMQQLRGGRYRDL